MSVPQNNQARANGHFDGRRRVVKAAYKLLALDIDGTLVDLQERISPRVREALADLRAAGVEIVLCTGRRYSRTLNCVAALGLTVPVVTASGALVKHPHDHRTLFQAQFAPGVLATWLEVVRQAGHDAILYTDSFGQDFDFYCPRLEVDSPELADYMRKNAGCGLVYPELFDKPPEGVFAGFAMGNIEQMRCLQGELDAILPGQLDTHVLRSPRYVGYMCEIAPAGATKWSGVLRLAGQWGITPDEICAVGDDVNDLAMVKGAGLGIAMGNAVAELRAAADRVAPSLAEDGLVQVARWVLDGDPR